MLKLLYVNHCTMFNFCFLSVEYKDENTQIPKNSSVIVRRIPTGTRSKAQLAAWVYVYYIIEYLILLN